MVANSTLFSGPVQVENFSSQLPFTLSLSAKQTAESGIAYPYNEALYPQTITSLENAGIISVNLVNTAIPAYRPNPYSLQYTFGIEQMLPKKVSLQVDYVGNHALHLIEYENNNQPNRITGVQPVPNFGTFFSFLNSDSSMYNGLQVNMARKSASYAIEGNYTWSKVLSYGDADLLQPTSPQDNGDLKAEHGPSPFDIRNRFVANGMWTLPIGKWTGLSSPLARRIVDGWRVTGVFTAQSGQPVDVMNTTSSAYPNDRPDGQTGPKVMPNYRRRNSAGVHQYLNPCIGSAATPNVATASSACSADPAAPAYSLVSASSTGVQMRGGTLGRYAQTGPGFMDLDASIAKIVPLRSGMEFQLRMDTFNTLNHTNYGGIINTINTPATFGQASAATPRTVQLGARLTF
jgi:hypothetical protein